MKVKFLAEVTISKRDMYGNCYYIVALTDTTTGESLTGQVGSCNNVKGYLRNAGLEWGEFRETESTIPIRQFDRLCKGMGYLSEEQITTFVKERG